MKKRLPLLLVVGLFAFSFVATASAASALQEATATPTPTATGTPYGCPPLPAGTPLAGYPADWVAACGPLCYGNTPTATYSGYLALTQIGVRPLPVQGLVTSTLTPDPLTPSATPTEIGTPVPPSVLIDLKGWGDAHYLAPWSNAWTSTTCTPGVGLASWVSCGITSGGSDSWGDWGTGDEGWVNIDGQGGQCVDVVITITPNPASGVAATCRRDSSNIPCPTMQQFTICDPTSFGVLFSTDNPYIGSMGYGASVSIDLPGSISTPTPTPTGIPDICQTLPAAQSSEPIVSGLDIVYTDGPCIVIVPEVGIEFPGFPPLWDGFEWHNDGLQICITWVDLGRLEVLGWGMAALLIVAPFIGLALRALTGGH